MPKVEAIALGPQDVPLARSVQTFKVTPGLTTTEIRDDQVVVSKSLILRRKQRQKKVETKQGASLGPEMIDATGGATEVRKRQLERKAVGGLFNIAYLTSKGGRVKRGRGCDAGVVELQGKTDCVMCGNMFQFFQNH